MTSESKAWQQLKGEYLCHVESALASVRHPRTRDVLEDVGAHLDRRLAELAPEQQTTENLRAIITDMGPPADYAELLEPERAAAPVGTPGRSLWWGALAGAVVIVLGVVAIVAMRETQSPPDRIAAEELAAEGWSAWRQQKLTQAETLFAQAVEKDPAHAHAWNGLGWAQFNQGKNTTAATSFEKCLDIEPAHAGALNGLGYIAKADNRIDEAISHWRRAIEALPSATAALSGLAGTYMERKQYDEAVEVYEKWLRVEPDNARVKADLEKAKQHAPVASRSDDGEAVSAAVAAARSWLKLIDDAAYAQGWAQSAGSLKQRVAEQQFQASLRSARGPLGKVLSREVLKATYTTRVPGAPDGQYVVIQFQSSFEHKASAVETITPALEDDGQWCVSGYYIR